MSYLDWKSMLVTWIMMIGFASWISFVDAFSDGWAIVVPNFVMFVAFLAVTSVPLMAVAVYGSWQDRLLDRMKALYSIAYSALSAGNRMDAEILLHNLRSVERKWKRRNGLLVKVPFFIGLAVLDFCLACVAWFGFHWREMIRKARGIDVSFGDVVEYVNDLGYLIAIGMFALVLAVWSMKDVLKVGIASRPWVDYYGDRLAQMLRAGRGIAEAPAPERRLAVVGSAREMLGLGEHFTAQELRRAWLGLVRELHPDRFATATGPRPACQGSSVEASQRCKRRIGAICTVTANSFLRDGRSGGECSRVG